jgi:hypothetical protein
MMLIRLDLDSSQFFNGMDDGLKHDSLERLDKMLNNVDLLFVQPNFITPLENKILGTPLPSSISNLGRSNV